MITVFELCHVHEWDDGHEEVKSIGIYSTRPNAEAALMRVRSQPGFRDCPEGFSIDERIIDPQVDGWSEGYVTFLPDGTAKE